MTRKYTDRVTRRIRGSDITRNASEEASAYMIQQDDGDRMLKRHKALRKA